MSNNLDLDKEGVVETASNPTDDDDNGSQEHNQVIQSNINKYPTDDGNDTKPSDDDHDSDDSDESDNNNSPDLKNNENKRFADANHDIPTRPQRSSHFFGTESTLWFITALIVVLISTIVPNYLHYVLPNPDPIGICSQIPDHSMRHKLQCPKCDTFDTNGKCIIYVPYSAQEFTLKGKGNDGRLNAYPCVHFVWDLDDTFVLSFGEDTENLNMTFISPGREQIELTIYINITDHKSGNMVYYKEKTCDIEFIIYEAPYFGIDMGTSYSCIAFQKPFINPNTSKRDTNMVIMDETKMEYCIPSSVYFGVNNSIYIGNKAKSMAVSNNDYDNLIYDIKRMIGRHSSDPVLKVFDEMHPFNLNFDESFPKIVIPNWSTNITPEQLLAVLLKQLVQTASKQFGVPGITEVVVSIPAIFHDAQRKAVHTSCQIAGLNAKLLVVEPSAASIAHTYYAPMDELRQFSKYFMTLDVGGGTTDVSILRCTGLHCEVLGVAGNSSLGGIDFDKVMVDIMVNKYKKLSKSGVVSTLLYDEIVAKAERVKKGLSLYDEYMVRLKHEEENSHQQIMITRKEFEENAQTVKLIESIIRLAKRAMFDDNRMSTKKGNEHLTNIKAILLIGGSVKIPLVQNMLRDEFQTKLIYPSDDPQLMVVKGSAIIGGSMAYTSASNADILYNQIPIISVDDVLPMSFGFDVCVIDYDEEDGHKCGVMDVLIQKNSKYPTKGSGIYCNKLPSASTATLVLYEGDDVDVKNNFFLTKLDISSVPPRSEYECNNIMVELSIDENGIANITAKTNNQIFSKELPVQSNDGHLTKQQIKLFKDELLSWF